MLPIIQRVITPVIWIITLGIVCGCAEDEPPQIFDGINIAGSDQEDLGTNDTENQAGLMRPPNGGSVIPDQAGETPPMNAGEAQVNAGETVINGGDASTNMGGEQPSTGVELSLIHI